MSLPRLWTLQNAKARLTGKLLPHPIFQLCLYSFYTAQSKSSALSINESTNANPLGTASTSTQPPLISGRKQKKHDPPSHPKASKMPKHHYDVDVDEGNEAIGEEMNDFDFDAAIPEGFTPQAEPSHTKFQKREAHSWQKLVPSIIHPFMAALHITENHTDGVVEMEAFTCVSRCCLTSFTLRWLMHFMSEAITPISIEHCNCISPAVTLLHHGSFPTTPKKAPTWAFEIKLLEFARLLSLYGSPNISALSNATTAFLLWCGV